MHYITDLYTLALVIANEPRKPITEALLSVRALMNYDRYFPVATITKNNH